MTDGPVAAIALYAITDTNVLLDIHSCHDVLGTYYEAHARLGDAAIDEPSVTYRRTRARESLLLAMHFNDVSANTYSLHFELVDLLTRRAPPAGGGETMESDCTTFFLHFVKDYVLPRWSPGMPAKPGTEVRNEADRALVALAVEHGLPLVTNEGYTQNGIVEQKMRKLAREAGVQVFAPREFYAGKIDEGRAIESFLLRFREQAPKYVAARRQMHGADDKGGQVLAWIYGYYRMILLGETAVRDAPVQVTL